MAAISGIVNPTGGKALVFFLNDALQCDLHLDSSDMIAADTTPAGPIRKPSAFASIMHKNLISVYGVVRHLSKPGQPANESEICVVSLENLWLYYLGVDGSLMEHLNDSSANPIMLKHPGIFPSKSTYLAAFCDTSGGRHVFYQTEDGEIRVYNQDDSLDGKVVAAEDAMKNSPMAVRMVMKGAVGTAYLYFSNPAHLLRRIQSVTNYKWIKMETLDHAELGDDTQLSVIGDDIIRENTIHYHKNRKLTTYTDVLQKETE